MRRTFATTLVWAALATAAHAQELDDPRRPEDGDGPLGPLPEEELDERGVSPSSASPAAVRFPGDYTLEDLPPSGRVDVGGGQPLTVGQVWSSVERHHPTIAAARADLRAAEGERLAAEGGFDLTVSGQAWMAPAGYYNWGRAYLNLYQPTPLWGATFFGGWRIGRPFESDEDVDPGIPSYYRNYETLTGGELRAGVRVPLWRDGPIDYRRRRLWRAEHAVDAYQRYTDATLLYLQYEAASAYWYWVAAGRKYEITAALLDLAEQRDTQIRARVAAGAIPAIEALENRRVILGRRRELVEARRALERAAIALSLYVRGRDGEPRVPPPARVPDFPEPPGPLEVDLAREIRRAVSTHPTLARYEALLERQEVSVDYAENRFAPRIDVQLEASIDLGEGNDRQQSTYEDPVVEGSVLLEVPLQFREARGGIARERGELASLREDARLARNRIAAGVRDAHSAVRAAEQTVEMARETAEVATAVAEAERRRFELGATELFVVNLREQYAAQARKYLAEAEAALQVARAQWRAATARGVAP
ncbi:MAG TPA: TolC family protein [Sandaracinaceae bacterium LLY-WYZ-13_1]|nr:TolC family protein [Sandaracinaceae bacterium LLY-WYZ-13_1]